MHLTEDEIEKLLDARLEPVDQTRIVRHLLAGCGLCSRKLVEKTPDGLLQRAADAEFRKTHPGGSLRDWTLAAALRQDSRWKIDESRLTRSLELLRTSPRGYDSRTLRQINGLQGPQRVEALIKRSFELRYSDPRAMRGIAYDAVREAEGLQPEAFGVKLEFLLDLQAAAWAELGNAYRLNEETAEAEASFRQARARLRAGTGNLLFLARVADLEASLRIAQRRLQESEQLLDRIHRIYLRLGDSHLAARIAIKSSTNLQLQGKFSEALSLSRQGLTRLDPGRDPKIAAVGAQGLLDILVDCKKFKEAGRLLLVGNLRKTFEDDPIGLLKLRWVEGKILAGLEKLPKAERAMIMVRSEFQEKGLPYEAALAGLDLLPVWIRQGHFFKAQKVAQDIYGTFRDLGIRHEAAKAQRYLQ